MATNPQLVFGFPPFAKEIQEAFPKLFEVLPRLTAALNDLTGRACEKPEMHQRVILNLGILAGVTMVELVTLAGNGLGQGATKIARTLMETVVNAEYLRQFPDELDAYLGLGLGRETQRLRIFESEPRVSASPTHKRGNREY